MSAEICSRCKGLSNTALMDLWPERVCIVKIDIDTATYVKGCIETTYQPFLDFIGSPVKVNGERISPDTLRSVRDRLLRSEDVN